MNGSVPHVEIFQRRRKAIDFFKPTAAGNRGSGTFLAPTPRRGDAKNGYLSRR
jgi:hypothetical protein